MSIKKLDKINQELINFAKSKFLKNEINEAFFIWNQNEYFTKEFSELTESHDNYLTFLDWFIYDYQLITTEKSLVSMYYEENKNKITSNYINSYRSIYKYTNLSDENYRLEDIINRKIYEINLGEIIPEDSSLISLRIIDQEPPVTIGHIIAYNENYKDFIYNSISEVIEKNTEKKDFSCKDYYYIIEKKINRLVNRTRELACDDKEKQVFTVLDFNGLYKKIEKTKDFELLSDDSKDFYLFKYYNKESLIFASIELYKKKVIFNNFNNTILDKTLLKLAPYMTDKIENIEVSEIWLNTKLEVLEGKTPIQAVKFKKFNNKINGIISDLELIHESRLSEDEISINPDYIKEKLNL